MPRNQPVFQAMSIARARFKYVPRQCHLDILAKHMQSNDVSTLKKSKIFKATPFNCVAWTSGETGIFNLWKDHYC